MAGLISGNGCADLSQLLVAKLCCVRCCVAVADLRIAMQIYKGALTVSHILIRLQQRVHVNSTGAGKCCCRHARELRLEMSPSSGAAQCKNV